MYSRYNSCRNIFSCKQKIQEKSTHNWNIWFNNYNKSRSNQRSFTRSQISTSAKCLKQRNLCHFLSFYSFVFCLEKLLSQNKESYISRFVSSSQSECVFLSLLCVCVAGFFSSFDFFIFIFLFRARR